MFKILLILVTYFSSADDMWEKVLLPTLKTIVKKTSTQSSSISLQKNLKFVVLFSIFNT